ncbi:MAG TPA: hypothetical protein VFE73_01380 [Reyranella sp.]|jgi:hypothetical protein|nr:hypothetical protein [Reyranella sp.]
MKSLCLIAAAMTFGLAAAACAQTQQAVVAPLDRSTGPTVPGSGDTRMQDQNTAVSPSTNNGTAQSIANDLGYGNWRTSDGFNSDPENPSGAPGSATITDSNRVKR